MENSTLLKGEQALGSDQLLKVTALLYLKEALIGQEYESCQELIDTAKTLGVDAGDISAVIADYLSTKGAYAAVVKAANTGKEKENRLRSY